MAGNQDAAKTSPAAVDTAGPYVGSSAVGTSKAAASAGVAAIGPEDNTVNQQRRRFAFRRRDRQSVQAHVIKKLLVAPHPSDVVEHCRYSRFMRVLAIPARQPLRGSSNAKDMAMAVAGQPATDDPGQSTKVARSCRPKRRRRRGLPQARLSFSALSRF